VSAPPEPQHRLGSPAHDGRSQTNGACPLVSVIVAVHDGERYLQEALDSVLRQTYARRELIVVDDGSTDGTAAILREMHRSVRAIHQPHAGVAAALNRGIEAAHGAMLAFLDADDLWVPEKLALQVEALRRHPKVEMVLAHLDEFLSPELPVAGERTMPEARRSMPGLHKGTMLIRREALMRVGLFDTKWVICDFVDWYARAMQARVRSLMLPEVVTLRRLHERNMTRVRKPQHVEYVRIARASLHRRRGSSPRSPSLGDQA
jgi:glycosyltransferase involved in cell wall biosynthesis